MSDQQLLDNYLLVLKSTVEVYVHGTLESSNNNVRKVLKKGLDSTLNCQSTTYDEMTKYGWYNIDNVKNSDIEKVYNKICNN